MTREQLIGMIVGERLSILLKKESCAEELDIIKKGEAMIQSLEEEKRAIIEDYTDSIMKEGDRKSVV